MDFLASQTLYELPYFLIKDLDLIENLTKRKNGSLNQVLWSAITPKKQHRNCEKIVNNGHEICCIIFNKR